MKVEAIKVRTSILYAFLGLGAAGILLVFASAVELWPVTFIVVLLAAWSVGRDVWREGFFHPVLLFGAFTLSMTLVGLTWMSVYMGGRLAFGAYFLDVMPGDAFVLAGEQLLVFLGVYVGFLTVSGIGARPTQPERTEHVAFASLWPAFYGLGVIALLYLIFSSGGFAELAGSLGEKYERAAGRGWAVVLTYFAYVGVLLWYTKNMSRPMLQRYLGLFLLLLPMLLTGSRTGMLVCLLAAAYLDEKAGRRLNLKILVPAGVLLVLFFAAYQLIRGQAGHGLLTAIAKDLSMGVGYVIAVREEIVSDRFRPQTMWLAISPFLPGPVENLLGVPQSPNYVFTQARVPGAPSTQSMGVMGEANYVLGYGWSLAYYFTVGALLTWVEIIGRRKGLLLLAAVIAGCTFRLAKGGLTAGVSNALLLLAPLAVAVLVYSLSVRFAGRSGLSGATRD